MNIAPVCDAIARKIDKGKNGNFIVEGSVEDTLRESSISVAIKIGNEILETPRKCFLYFYIYSEITKEAMIRENEIIRLRT